MKRSLLGLLLSFAVAATGGAQAISDLPQPAAGLTFFLTAPRARRGT